MINECRIPRSAERKAVLMKATIVNADGSQDVRVNDLTESGARITCDRPIPSGEDVLFKRGTMLVAARVAWSKRGEAGIEFYRTLSAAEIAGT